MIGGRGLGEFRSRHGGVISAFGQLIVKRQGVDVRTGRLLRSLYDRRSHADYDLGPVPQEVADQAIEDAETVAGIISHWGEDPKGGGRSRKNGSPD